MGNNALRSKIQVVAIIMLAVSIFTTALQAVSSQDTNLQGGDKDKGGRKKPKAKFNGGNKDAIPGEYIVYFTAEVKDSEAEKLADELIARYGGSIKTNDIIIETKQADNSVKTDVVSRGKKVLFKGKSNKGFHALMTEAQAKALSEDPKVDHVSENVRMQAPANTKTLTSPGTVVRPPDNFQQEPNSPTTDQVGADYNLDRIDTRSRTYNNTYTYFNTGSATRAYIVDTGLEISHQEFKPGDSVVHFTGPNPPRDCNGHGTAVASLVGGVNRGVAKQVKLIGIRTGECNNTHNMATLLQGLDYIESDSQAQRPTPSVVNMSLSTYDPLQSLVDLDNTVYELIHDYNVPTVCSVGQKSDGTVAGPQSDWTPGRVPGTITVGMTDSLDRKVRLNIFAPLDTAYGSYIDLFAPGGFNYNISPAAGVLVADAFNLSLYVRRTGTSVAAPLVTGVVAQYLQSNWYARPDQVKTAILDFVTNNVLSNLDTGDPNKLLYEPFSMPGFYNAASYARGTAPDSLGTLFVPFSTFPGTHIKIGDSGFLPLNIVSSMQANYYIPNTIPYDTIPTVKFYTGQSESGYIGTGTIVVNRLASALFSADGSGQGLVSGQLLRVNKANPADQTYETLTAAGNVLNPETEDDYFVLYGTGFRLRSSLSAVTLSFDGINIPVIYADLQGSPGLDQVNAGPLTANLKGRINKDLRLVVEGQVANIVKASLQ